MCFRDLLFFLPAPRLVDMLLRNTAIAHNLTVIKNSADCQVRWEIAGRVRLMIIYAVNGVAEDIASGDKSEIQKRSGQVPDPLLHHWPDPSQRKNPTCQIFRRSPLIQLPQPKNKPCFIPDRWLYLQSWCQWVLKNYKCILQRFSRLAGPKANLHV